MDSKILTRLTAQISCRVSGAMNLVVGLWSLRNKCNQAIQHRGRPACGASKRLIPGAGAPHAGLPLLWLHYLFKATPWVETHG